MQCSLSVPASMLLHCPYPSSLHHAAIRFARDATVPIPSPHTSLFAPEPATVAALCAAGIHGHLHGRWECSDYAYQCGLASHAVGSAARQPVCAYTTLGVQPDASLLELKAAYRAEVKKHHPDLQPSGPAQVI